MDPRIKRLAKLKRAAPRNVTLEDLIFDSFNRTLETLGAISDSVGDETMRLTTVSIGELTLSFERDAGQGGLERLRAIATMARSLETEGYDFEASVQSIARADGWTLTRGRIKSPGWLRDHIELDVSSIPEDLECLRSIIRRCM